MKVGLIARGEDRGLGIQTWEAHRHLAPERTLVVDMGPLAGGWASHHEARYPGAELVPFDGHRFPEAQTRAWLEGLDVVLSCETLYDWRLADWAREQGVATVVQVNPEFYRHSSDPLLAHPTMWWNPTTWLMDSLPVGTRHVPVPVALDRWPDRLVPDPPRGLFATSDPLRVLHVTGKRAAGDRNGTMLVAMALRRTKAPMRVRVLTQERRMFSFTRRPNIDVATELGGRRDYWDLYDDADVLVMPRRYGGLCLPVQEAMAAGLAVVMTDCAPNTTMWPVVPVKARRKGELGTPSGPVTMWEADDRVLGAQLDQLATYRGRLNEAQHASVAWAVEHSWEALLPMYRAELALAADRAAIPAS